MYKHFVQNQGAIMASSVVKKINTNTPAADHLIKTYLVASGPVVVNKAIELGIFDFLYKEKEPISVEEMAKKNKFKPDVLGRVLNCLTALEMVNRTKKGGTAVFSNSKSGDYLAESNPENLLAVPGWEKMIATEIAADIDTIRVSETDEPKMEEDTEEEPFDWSTIPADLPTYQGLHNILLPQAKALVTHHDLGGYKNCYDLGGGTGVIGFELRRQYPQMEVTVVEHKNIVNMAKEKFVPGNEALGVKFLIGDFFKLDFPNADLFVVGAIIRSLTDKEKDKLLSTCFKALKPGGAFLALEQMQNDEKDGSLAAILWDMTLRQMGAGLMTPSEYKELFTKHGFTDVTCTLTQDWNDYDIIYAKKPNN